MTMVDQAVVPLLSKIISAAPAQVEERDANGARVYDIPVPVADPEDRAVILDLHGGGLLMCGGELCRMMGIGAAYRLRKRVW